MKKIIIGLSLIILFVMGLIGNVNAASAKVTLSTEKPEEITKGSKVEISVNLSNITTTKGVAAFMGTIEYDDKESLKFEKIESQNGWSSGFTYNADNGKIVINKGNNVTQTEAIFKIIFTVTDKAKQNLIVTLKDMTFSEGIEDIEIPSSYIRLTVKEGTQNPIPNPGEDTPKPNPIPDTGNKNQVVDNTATGKLPQTGVSNIFVIVGGVTVTILAIVLFIRMRMMKLN